jgi:hypothetical protein
MSRKTIPVKSLVEKTNSFLLHSDDKEKEARQIRMLIIEDILHETGNYRGFCYLHWNDMALSENGESVGINYNEDMELLPYDEGNARFNNTDNTRVYYFI